MPDVGEVLGGKYRLVSHIGKGGFGAVFEAEHVQIGKRVAIKVLRGRRRRSARRRSSTSTTSGPPRTAPPTS